jgi:hypothetical protein
MAHTYAILEIGQAAYAEIRDKLEVAGYQHAFHKDGSIEVIDMHGIAVQAKSMPKIRQGDDGDLCVCGHRRGIHNDHGKCMISKCACGPGCIHDGFVRADEKP